MTRSNTNPKQRAKQRQFLKCEVRDCSRFVYSLSRFCTRHHLRSLRYGDPNGRAILKMELKPYAKSVTSFLKANEGHPALVYVFGLLRGLLDDAAKLGPVPGKLKPLDYQSRLRKELQRLHAGGVTGEEMFLAVATVWLFAEERTRTLPPLSIAFRFAVARSVIGLRTRFKHNRNGTGAIVTNRTSTLLLNHLGLTLVRLLHPLMGKLVETITRQQHAQRMHQARLAAVIEQQPFT